LPVKEGRWILGDRKVENGVHTAVSRDGGIQKKKRTRGDEESKLGYEAESVLHTNAAEGDIGRRCVLFLSKRSRVGRKSSYFIKGESAGRH